MTQKTESAAPAAPPEPAPPEPAAAALATFAEAARAALGPDRVEGPAPGLVPDTLHRVPSVHVLLRPRTVEEVQGALALARDHGQPLHPVSTGRNWGYGTAVPAAEDTRVILHLEAMDRIHDFDAELGLVTLEPGVTQGKLAAFLAAQGARYMVPTTGAGPSVSLVGNALERGCGLTPVCDHFGAVTALEAVLPDGTLYRSPFLGAKGGPPAFKWGTGPYLDGLFSQFGGGVVTRMTLRLAPLPERVEAFFVTVEDDAKLEALVTAFRRLLSESGVPLGGVNLINGQRVRALAGEKSPVGRAAWFATGALFGDAAVVRASRKTIRAALKGVARRVIFVSETRAARMQAILDRLGRVGLGRRIAPLVENAAGVLAILAGQPSEFGLPLAYGADPARMPKRDLNPARDGCGLLWYAPAVPARGDAVRAYAGMVERVCAAHGFDGPITLTSSSPLAYISSMPILFRATEQDSARAMACLRALVAEGRALGLHPYRYHMETMDQALGSANPFWALAGRVKAALDPDGLISPGRYAPAQAVAE